MLVDGRYICGSACRCVFQFELSVCPLLFMIQVLGFYC